MNVVAFTCRMLFYATHPRQLRNRIGAVVIRGRSISYHRDLLPHYLRKLAYYLRRPKEARKRYELFRDMSRRYGASRDGLDVSTRGQLSEPLSHTALSNVFYNHGLAIYERDRHELAKAIGVLEKAFVLTPSPRIGLRLAFFQQLANRHRHALETLRKAFQANPDDRELWHQSITCVLRYGTGEEARDLLASVLQRDANYSLARFFDRILRDFSDYVKALEDSISATRNTDKPQFAIAVAVWGNRYADLFLNYTLASLLAAGNLPAVSQTHDLHVIVFTTMKEKQTITANPHYERASTFAHFHFVEYDLSLIAVSNSKDLPIAVNARFALMSAAHYAVLECARRMKFDATILGGDNIVNADFLSNIVSKIDRSDPSVIACPGFRLPMKPTLETTDARHRGPDGTLSLSGKDFIRLLWENLPEAVFVDSKKFSRFPLFLCWRVDGEGILLRANHYHPVMIRGKYLREINAPSIDPIDGRFLKRHLTTIDRIHLTTDSDICLFDATENPLVALLHGKANPFDANEVGLWLWQFNDGLREKYFNNSVEYPLGIKSPMLWKSVEQDAKTKVGKILEHMHALELQNPDEKSWCL